MSANLAGARILADRYGAMLNRIVVPKGRTDWRAHANEFVEEAKASGAVHQFIERAASTLHRRAIRTDRADPGRERAAVTGPPLPAPLESRHAAGVRARRLL